MFFYLSQLLGFLVMPFSICLLLLSAGILIKNRKRGKSLIVGSLFLLLFFSNSYLSNWALVLWEPPIIEMASMPVYEVGIVLTGVTNLNKSTSDRTFFNKGADRATHAMQLYKMGKIKKILVTGGQGFGTDHNRTEAQLLTDFLVLAGVDQKDIITETKAKNTRENALFSEMMLTKKGYDHHSKLLVITSAFHIKRARACFKKVGLTVDSFPVDYYGSDPILNVKAVFQPSPESISNWHKLVKEWIGLIVYRMVGYI
ncbi:MAG: YdcF family protein [Cyclobacteriaceae bacterium]